MRPSGVSQRRQGKHANLTRAVNSHVRALCACSHLKAALGHRALDAQPGGFHSQRLKEEDVAHARRVSFARGTSNLEVAHGWEDHTIVHDVISHEQVESASGRRAEEDVRSAWRGSNLHLRKGMRCAAPRKAAPRVDERRSCVHVHTSGAPQAAAQQPAFYLL